MLKKQHKQPNNFSSIIKCIRIQLNNRLIRSYNKESIGQGITILKNTCELVRIMRSFKKRSLGSDIIIKQCEKKRIQ